MCRVEDCVTETYARGLCRKHYQRWRKTGDPLGIKPRPAMSEETKRKIGAANSGKPSPRRGQKLPESHVAKLRGHPVSPETRSKISTSVSAARKGRKRTGEPMNGEFVTSAGYRCLTSQQEHPLAVGTGSLLEHRAVLYDKIGPGSHLCHWGCGKVLTWGVDLFVDHLDSDRLNNDPDNLVPSCNPCNMHRGKKVI